MSGREPMVVEPTARNTVHCQLLAVGLLSLIAATWKLWIPQSAFPQVPLLRAACELPGWIDWTCLAVLIVASVALFIAARPGRFRRISAAAVASALAAFFVLDQHRLQPWAWQFFLLSLLLALADDSTVRRGWVWLVISIYFWSAVSKLDYTFCHDQGPALIRGLKHAIGIRGIPNRWTDSIDIGAALVLALGELVVAILLSYSRTRPAGLWAATVMHLGLLLALGPLGLNHSHGVLLWNLFFIAQDWLLFGHRSAINPSQARPANPASLRQRVVQAFIGLVIVWPALELVGYCDHWLGWAVYSARSDQAEVIVNPDIEPEPAINRTIDNRLLIAPWSLQQLAAPVYPQHRFLVGVVLDLAEHHQFRGTLVLKKTPDRFSGQPAGENLTIPVEDAAAVELNHVADTFFWNARPRRLTSGQ